MALPGTVTGLTQANEVGRCLFVASDGDLFTIGFSTTTVSVYRSTDGGETWGSAVTTTAGRNVAHLDAYADGDTLHVAWHTIVYASGMDDLADLEYQAFDMSTNTWSGSVDVVDSGIVRAASGNSKQVAVIKRSADVVILYQGDVETTMGSDYDKVMYARGSAGSWGTTGQAVSPAGAESARVGGMVNSLTVTNDVHLFFTQNTGTQAVEAKTLRAGNTLSTIVSDTAPGGVTFFQVDQHVLAWSDGGTPKYALITREANANTNHEGLVAGEDGSDDIAAPTGEAFADENAYDQFASGISTPLSDMALAKDPDSDDFYVFWYSDDGTTNPDDLMYAIGTDGATWGTPVVAETISSTGDPAGAGALGFTHSAGNGGSAVIGYIYDDNGTFKYNEIDLGSSPDATVTPTAAAVNLTDDGVARSAGAARAPAAELIPVTDPITTRSAGAARAPAAAQMVMTADQAAPAYGWTATPTAEQITMTADQAVRAAGATRAVTTEAITMTVDQAVRSAGAARAPAVEAIPLTGPQIARLAGATRLPVAETITITSPQAVPDVSSGGTDATVTPAAEVMAITGPQIARLAGATRTPAGEIVPMTDLQVTRVGGATRVPAVEVMAITGPQVTRAAGATRAPTVEAIAIVAPQADLATGWSVALAAGVIAITGPQQVRRGGATRGPTVEIVPLTGPQTVPAYGWTVIPAAEQITLTGPQTSRAAGATRTPAVEVVTLTGPQAVPVISIPSVTVTPAAEAITLTGPQASTATGWTVTSLAGELLLVSPQATRRGSASRGPSSGVVTIFGPQTTRSAGATRTAAPGAISLVSPETKRRTDWVATTTAAGVVIIEGQAIPRQERYGPVGTGDGPGSARSSANPGAASTAPGPGAASSAADTGAAASSASQGNTASSTNQGTSGSNVTQGDADSEAP